MEANSHKVELRTSLLLSQKIIFHIGPLPLLVAGLLSSCIYGKYCTGTLHIDICTAISFFVLLSRLVEPKQMLSLNDIFYTKLSV